MKNEHKYTFKEIKLDNILATDNIREITATADLKASIKEHGVINPVTVKENGDGSYTLLAGFRRFSAANQLGMEKIPCHVFSGDEKNIDEIPLTENVSRLDMTQVEECLAVAHLINKKNTPKTVARKFGKSLRWVLVRLKIANAGEKATKKLEDGDLTLSAATKLADLPDEDFKNVIEEYGFIDDDTANEILEKYHLDLEKAPFDNTKCKTCEKCSACQTDLFEDEPKAYCLDPKCYQKKCKDAANKKLKELLDEGKNARFGKFASWGVHSDDEAYNYAVRTLTDKAKEAEEKGLQKRVLVDENTAAIYEYYDERDFPDFHEETEEEREARYEAENKERDMNSIAWNMHKEKIEEEIQEACSKNTAALVTLLFLDNNDLCLEDLDEEVKEKIGFTENEAGDYPDAIEFLVEKKFTPEKIMKLVKENTDILFGNLYYNIDIMKNVYKIICNKDADKLKPSKKAVEKEYNRVQEEKNKDSEEDEE